MNEITIWIPDSLKQFVEDQVSAGAYKSTSEYLERLISEDQANKESEAMEKQILEAIDRGEFSPMTTDDWGQLESEIQAQARLRAHD